MSKQKTSVKAVFRRIIFVLSTIILIGITTAAICGVTFAMYINNYIRPQITLDLTNVSMNFSSIIYYKDKNTGEYLELEKIHGAENRIWANFEEIPQDLKNAFVAIEDSRFYEHNGVDWIRTLGAAANWVIPFRDGFGGGSTITQQLVKNLTEENDYSVTRKIKEILTALEVEEQLNNKDDILELYLNRIYLGRQSYGVKTAAMTYFGKDLDELNLAECAILAGITNNPSLYDPFRYPENIKKRQELILKEMLDQEMITQAQHDEAVAAELVYKEEENQVAISTPRSWFEDEVIRDVLSDLQTELGYSESMAETLMFSGGLQVYSTVDLDVQAALDTVFADEENFPGREGRTGQLPQAAMTIMDPYTGYVLGIVGGRGEKEADMILNRASQSERSPGSSIKPISAYAPAIDQGLITPYSVITDSPFNFTGRSTGWPKNSNGVYRGQMTITNAVKQSTNTIAVKVIDLVSPQMSYEYLTKNLGIDTLVEREVTSSGAVLSDIDYAPLALGGLTDGVTTKAMTAAFAPFVNDGMYNQPKTYTKVLDANGNVLLDNETEATVAYENEKTSYYMTYMLEQVVSGGTGSGSKIANMDTAGKTGTTDDNHDRWFVGYTPYYVAATWFGYDKPEVISGVSQNPAMVLWKDVMDIIHEGKEPAQFKDYPDNFVSASYCLDSGMAPTAACSADVRGSRVASGMFHPDDVPSEACNLHKSVEVDAVTGMIANEYCPEENIKTVSLLDLTRLFSTQISLQDEGYTATIENEPIGTGVPPYLPDGGVKYNKVCDVHNVDTHAQELEDELKEQQAEDEDPEAGGVDPEEQYPGSNIIPDVIPVQPGDVETEEDEEDTTSQTLPDPEITMP